MGLVERVMATAKNIEGKFQEAAGDLTGDPKIKEEGQEKQIEANISHTIENIKDEAIAMLDQKTL